MNFVAPRTRTKGGSVQSMPPRIGSASPRGAKALVGVAAASTITPPATTRHDAAICAKVLKELAKRRVQEVGCSQSQHAVKQMQFCLDPDRIFTACNESGRAPPSVELIEHQLRELGMDEPTGDAACVGWRSDVRKRCQLLGLMGLHRIELRRDSNRRREAD